MCVCCTLFPLSADASRAPEDETEDPCGFGGAAALSSIQARAYLEGVATSLWRDLDEGHDSSAGDDDEEDAMYVKNCYLRFVFYVYLFVFVYLFC